MITLSLPEPEDSRGIVRKGMSRNVSLWLKGPVDHGPAQRGHASFYAVLLLPVALGFCVLAVDVSGWNALRDTLQEEADQLAIEAVQQLPDVLAASSVIKERARALQERNIVISPVQDSVRDYAYLSANDLGIGVRLSASYRSAFLSLLPDTARQQGSLFGAMREAEAELVPTDYAIILPDGPSMRPGADYNNASFEQPWGDASDWPASGYFSCATSAPPDWLWSSSWYSTAFRRWMTQSCFNPIFTPLKLAVISLIDALLSMRGNRLALLFTPGDDEGRGLSFLRQIHGESVANGIPYYFGQIGGFIDPQGVNRETSWPDYREPNTQSANPRNSYFGDHLCLLLSSPDTDYGNRYLIPSLPRFFPRQRRESSDCASPLDTLPCGKAHAAYDLVNSSQNTLLSGCYFSTGALRLREAVYWHAAKPAGITRDAEPQTILALEQAFSDLIDIRHADVVRQDREVRGNFASSSLRRIILFTDRLTELETTDGQNRVRRLLRAAASANSEVIIVGFRNRYHPPTPSLQQSLEKLADIGEDLLTREEIYENTLRIIPLGSPEELPTALAPQLAILGRRIALKR